MLIYTSYALEFNLLIKNKKHSAKKKQVKIERKQIVDEKQSYRQWNKWRSKRWLGVVIPQC